MGGTVKVTETIPVFRAFSRGADDVVRDALRARLQRKFPEFLIDVIEGFGYQEMKRSAYYTQRRGYPRDKNPADAEMQKMFSVVQLTAKVGSQVVFVDFISTADRAHLAELETDERAIRVVSGGRMLLYADRRGRELLSRSALSARATEANQLQMSSPTETLAAEAPVFIPAHA